ncbi:MAG: L-lactate permease [Chloroflexi bacterium]|nr:L-lactate permease [Chloroflexota bacterium]
MWWTAGPYATVHRTLPALMSIANHAMPYLLAALPILIVLALMLLLHWGGQRAGPAGWIAGVAVAAFTFGLTPQVLWVSQLKGLLLSLYVLAVLWPALLLYNVVNQAGGIRALARALERAIGDRGMLLIVMAWAFSGLLEGLAGFGIPIAVVAPMLVSLGVAPVMAVAAVAVGHSWSVTFGDMGVIFQTLTAVTGLDGASLAPAAAGLLGLACLACGLAAARLLGEGHRWPLVFLLALLMAVTQGTLALAGLTPLAALGAGMVGVLAGVVLSSLLPNIPSPSLPLSPALPLLRSPALQGALLSYGGLMLLMGAIALIQPLRAAINPVVWQMNFPAVVTLTGFVTPAGPGQAFRVLVHPGTSIFLVAVLSYSWYRRTGHCSSGSWRGALAATWRSAAPSSAGILAMVGLAALMDHCGMTLLLAQGLSALMGAAFPLVSPSVGVLGAFATGSNNNSNVLFGQLQKSAAILLAIDPRILLAAQTAGGSLGSMLAPAKIIVGCSTVGLKGRDGEVLRHTLPYGVLIGLALGVVAWLLTALSR